MLVLGFSGRIGSGKTTISTAVAEYLGIPRVSFGDYTRAMARYLGIDDSHRETLQDIGAFLMRYPEALCRKVLEQAAYEAGQPLILDGIRHPRVVDEIRKLVAPAQLVLVYIGTAEAELARRHELRSDQDELRQLEQHATEFHVLNSLPRLADVYVSNDGGRSIPSLVVEIVETIQSRYAGESAGGSMEERPNTPLEE
jgi:dephospho-CoA kinase